MGRAQKGGSLYNVKVFAPLIAPPYSVDYRSQGIYNANETSSVQSAGQMH